jgi:YggT family protein
LALLIIRLIDMVINILTLLIFVRVILSWLPIDPRNQLVRLLYDVTEPLLAPFRFARLGMMDFSPFCAIIALEFIGRVVLDALYRLFLY